MSICTIKLVSAVMLSVAYDGGGASQIGQQGRMIYCSGW